jgi:hypothetical protein
MVITGLLLGLRRGEFVDKSTGEQIRFCHLKVAQPSDNPTDVVGLDDQKIKVPFELFDQFRREISDLIGRNVQIEVELKIRGKYVGLTAVHVRPLSAPAPALKAA